MDVCALAGVIILLKKTSESEKNLCEMFRSGSNAIRFRAVLGDGSLLLSCLWTLCTPIAGSGPHASTVSLALLGAALATGSFPS